MPDEPGPEEEGSHPPPHPAAVCQEEDDLAHPADEIINAAMTGTRGIESVQYRVTIDDGPYAEQRLERQNRAILEILYWIRDNPRDADDEPPQPSKAQFTFTCPDCGRVWRAGDSAARSDCANCQEWAGNAKNPGQPPSPEGPEG